MLEKIKYPGILDKVEDILSGSENKEKFFRRIEAWFPSSDPRYLNILEAYEDAKIAFKERKRNTGERYFEHLRAVALILIDYLKVRDYEVIIAALLHDIVEDIPSWTIERVRLKYGERVALLVHYATKPSKKEYSNKEEALRVYHNRFEYAPREFWKFKLSDRLHNLLRMWGAFSLEKIRYKIEETKRYYLPYAEEQIILIHELEEAINKLEEAIKESKN